MGQIVRRKRKGRPSSTDRARPNSSAAPPSPVDRRRSRRRRNVRYHFDIDDYVDDDEFYDDEDEEVGRREKKLRLLLCQADSRSNRRVTHAPVSSSSEDDFEDDDRKPSKKRKIHGEDDEDNEIDEIRGRKSEEEEDFDEDEEEEEAGGSDFVCGTASDLPKMVPLPDKRTLELILDKLQKKDIYGVYAQPVDPDELPDYHDVIKHPMDFATVRKKLAKGLYSTLKEFESDVFLICTNAMQYNAPDTIYYKQASSIQEQAKLRFQRLRANVDRSEIEPKSEPKNTPYFSLPKKQLKKAVAQDPVSPETFSGANVRTGDFPNGSPAQTPVRANSSEAPIAENSSLLDNNLDKEQELQPGKGFISKFGRKPSVVDENRRATYDPSVEPLAESNSIFSTFEGESKQFIPVGLHAEHSYARSLARFAATLGSVAWKVASQTIEQALPEGVKFGRGWVGEYEPLSTPILVPENRTMKQPNFLSHLETSSNVRNIEKVRNDPVGVRESPRENGKDSRPPFISSLQKNAAFAQLNHQPPTRSVSNASDITSPRPMKPVSRNANLAPFKHPNSGNGGFVPGRPDNGKPTPVSLDCNTTVPRDNNSPYRQEQKPMLVNRDCNRQEQLSDPVQMMKILAEKSQPQLNNNSNGVGFGFASGSPVGLKKEESTNVALTAAQAWMSLGGLVKPPLVENTNPHKQQISVDSLYNPARERQQPQVSRFRGEFPVPGVQFQQPVHAFVPQPVRNMNDANLQNRNVGYPQIVTADLSRFQVQPSWRGVSPQMQQQPRPKQQESRPPDLNIGYQSMGSPVRQSTGMMVDSQQPDLALQL